MNKMYYEVIGFNVLKDYHIWLKFDDNSTKIIDFKPFIKGEPAKELSNYEYFNEVKIDSGGGLVWPNGYDFCPNFLKEHVESTKQEAEDMVISVKI
ncbi:MAG TPA: DUF2442 domain-containing protein [Thermodesulfovibrionia bacterium]|nr:DUF2442 domain-containing protein [Thermodesulfovibrionia bacterium]